MSNSYKIENNQILFDEEARAFANKSIYALIRRLRNGSSRGSDFEVALTGYELLLEISNPDDADEFHAVKKKLSDGRPSAGLERALVYFLVDINMLIEANQEAATPSKAMN